MLLPAGAIIIRLLYSIQLTPSIKFLTPNIDINLSLSSSNDILFICRSLIESRISFLIAIPSLLVLSNACGITLA